MACYDGLISIKGLCQEDDNVLYYLDDIGISLQMAAKVVDPNYGTGKRLIEAKIEQGWKEVFKDIQYKGMNANKILNDDIVGVNSTDSVAANASYRGMTFTLDKSCKLARFYISKVVLSVANGGSTSVRLTEGTTNTTIYTGTPNDNTETEIVLNQYVSDFTISADNTNIEVLSGSTVTDEYYRTGGCCETEYYTVVSTDTAGQSYGLTVYLQVRCDKDRHSCKFVDKIASAARYKIAALIWDTARNSNAFNDLLNIKKSEAVVNLAWLDSTYNLLKYDPSADATYSPKGMYQKELALLNLPVPKCGCCLECVNEKMVISLP